MGVVTVFAQIPQIHTTSNTEKYYCHQTVWKYFLLSKYYTVPPILLHYFLKAQYTTWKITWVTALWFRRLFVPQSFCKPFYLYVLRPWHQYFSGLQGCLIISKVALGMINHPNKVTYWLCKNKVRALNMYVVLPIMFECLALFMNDKIPITKGYAMKRTLRRPFSCRENKPLSLFPLMNCVCLELGKTKYLGIHSFLKIIRGSFPIFLKMSNEDLEKLFFKKESPKMLFHKYCSLFKSTHV